MDRNVDLEKMPKHDGLITKSPLINPRRILEKILKRRSSLVTRLHVTRSKHRALSNHARKLSSDIYAIGTKTTLDY